MNFEEEVDLTPEAQISNELSRMLFYLEEQGFVINPRINKVINNLSNCGKLARVILELTDDEKEFNFPSHSLN